MAAQTESTTLLSPLSDIFSDLRVRYGIKLSLASLLSLYLALLIRLEHPNWAVLTALVMMNSHYVGSTVVKAMLRCVGTVAGAFIGIWLVGDYTSTPVLFLLFFFIILGIAVYKFGQYPASQAPYAYYLAGLTTLTVATYGIQDPYDAWVIGLNRALEILVGSLSSLLSDQHHLAALCTRRVLRTEPQNARNSWRGCIAGNRFLHPAPGYIRSTGTAPEAISTTGFDASQSASIRRAGEHSLLWTPWQL